MLGIVIAAENAPDELAVMLDGVVAIVLASNFTVMLLLAVNPEPEIETEVLTPPEVGVSVIVADGFAVKVADPVRVPSVAETA
ncbi:MAG: hypothetical protein HMLIMOIP_001152 [Candidatus Nitrosomirales archaeon]